MTELQTRAKPTFNPAPASAGVDGLLQRKCACGGSAGLSGGCEECRKKRLGAGSLQTKLAIGTPGDQYEQEADRLADHVMRRPDRTVTPGSPSAPTPLVQRRAAPVGVEPEAAPAIVQEVVSSPGDRLDAVTRAFFEPRFGHDFGSVRVHADGRAAESSEAVNALAYTVGSHIVFAARQYAPGSISGKKLLAHELTHVVQQRSSDPGTYLQRKPCDAAEVSTDDPLERLILFFGEQGAATVTVLLRSGAQCELAASYIAERGALPPETTYSVSDPRTTDVLNYADLGVQLRVPGLAAVARADRYTVEVRHLRRGPAPDTGGAPKDPGGDIDDVSVEVPDADGVPAQEPVPGTGSLPGPQPPSQDPPSDDAVKIELTDSQRAKLRALQSLGDRSEGLRNQLENLNDILRQLDEIPLPGGIERETLIPIPTELLPRPDALILLGGVLRGASARSEAAADACGALLDEIDALVVELGIELAWALGESGVTALLESGTLGLATPVTLAIWARRLERLRRLLERLDTLVGLVDQIADLVQQVRELPDRYAELTAQLDKLQGTFEEVRDPEALFSAVDVEEQMDLLEEKIRSLLLEQLGAEDLSEDELERFLTELPEGFQSLGETRTLYTTPSTDPDHQDILFASAFRTGSLLHPIVTLVAQQATASLGSISIPTGIDGRKGGRGKPGRGKAGQDGKDSKGAKDRAEGDDKAANDVNQAELKRFVSQGVDMLEAAFAKDGGYRGEHGKHYWSKTWFHVLARLTLADVNEKAKVWTVHVGEGTNKREKKLSEVAHFKLKDWHITDDDASVDLKLNPEDPAKVNEADDVISPGDPPKEGIAVPHGDHSAIKLDALAKDFNDGNAIKPCAESNADDEVCRDENTIRFRDSRWPAGTEDDPIPMTWPKRHIDSMNHILLGAPGEEKQQFTPKERKTIATSGEATAKSIGRLENDIPALEQELTELRDALAVQKATTASDADLVAERDRLKKEELANIRAFGQVETRLRAAESALSRAKGQGAQKVRAAEARVAEAERDLSIQQRQRELIQESRKVNTSTLAKFAVTPEQVTATETALKNKQEQLNEMKGRPMDKLTVGLDADNWPTKDKKVQRVQIDDRVKRRSQMEVFDTQLQQAGLEVEMSPGMYTPTNYQVDHVLDLAMGGKDQSDNLWPIPSGQNASVNNTEVMFQGEKLTLGGSGRAFKLLVGKWFIIKGFDRR